MKILKRISPYFIIASIVLITVIALIWIDHETKTWSQVFGHNLLIGIVLYGLPIMMVVSLFYWKLKGHLPTGLSIIVSAMGGIPLSTAVLVVIYLLVL